MYQPNDEMGENFTGVKNQKLTRLAACLAAVVALAAAADLALVQPADLTAQLAGKGARPAVFMVGPNVLYRSKHLPGSVYAGPGQSEAGLAMLKAEAGKLPRDREVVVYLRVLPVGPVPERQAGGGDAEADGLREGQGVVSGDGVQGRLAG
jgi:hypothetical protein